MEGNSLTYETLRTLLFKFREERKTLVAEFRAGHEAYMDVIDSLPAREAPSRMDAQDLIFGVSGVPIYEDHDVPLRVVRAFNSEGKLLKEIQL
jgi:hypothetical protein